MADESLFQTHRRNLLRAVAALPLASACAAAPQSVSTQSPGAFRVVEHQWVPMPDGVRLSARLWLPDGETPSPAVLECIPYRKRDLYRPYDDIWGATLAAAGIAFVRLDVRGTGDSEGAITDEYSEVELDDCVEAIAWIARQPWCSGAVGMRGLSWGGINTLQVAARRPPSLKAIVPMGCCDARYTDDAHYIGGALARPNFQWGVLFKGVMAAPPDPLIVGDSWRDMWTARLEATPPILETWTRHQREDAYWRRGSVAIDYAAIITPALLVSGWSDAYAHPVLRLLGKLASPARAVIGPWGHTYPNLAGPQGLDWGAEEIRWWRHWLRDEPAGIMDAPALRAYQPYMTASEAAGRAIPGRWIAESAWRPPRAPRTFHLNPGHLDAAATAETQLVHRDRGVVGSTRPEWLDRLPIEQSHDDTLSTVFDTAPLPAPLDILGAPVARLRLASDVPVASVSLRLCEVRPDGDSRLVTWGVLNLTRRDSLSDPAPLEPGRAYDVTVELRSIAHRFSAGSRIRLALSEGCWPMIWPSPVQPTLTLTTGVSTLDLPVRPPESQPYVIDIAERLSPAEPPAAYAPATPDANGRIVLVNASPVASYPVAGAEIELSSEREETCAITAGDPLSCIWRQRTRSSWRRDSWSCAVEASYVLTCDASSFHLVETLRAFEGDAERFARRHHAIIPRDLM